MGGTYQMPAGNEEKLGELIVYISLKSASDPRFGATKLNKLLFFADYLAMGHFGKPISGVDYQHLPNGPAPRRLLPIRESLEHSKSIAVQDVPLQSGNAMVRTLALRKANLEAFTADEIALVDDLIDKHWDDDADSISRTSHNYVGWKMTKNGDSIPYGSIFLSDAPLTEEEIYRGQELAKEYGWVT
jgi:hypothetical protein